MTTVVLFFCSKSSGSSGLSCFQQGTVVGAAATAGGCSKGTDARQQPPNKALLPPLSSSDPPASGGVPCGAKKIGSHKLKAKGKVVAERVAAEMAGSIGSSTKAAGVESEGCGGNQISGSSNLGEQRQSSSGAHASVHENKAAKVGVIIRAYYFCFLFLRILKTTMIVMLWKKWRLFHNYPGGGVEPGSQLY